MKLYTALACGKPMVTSRLDGVEFIEEGDLGRLAECDDPEDFARALQSLLDLSSEEREEMTRRARRYAEENCGWDDVAERVLGICSEAL